MRKLLLYIFLLCVLLLANAQKPILPDFHADPSIHFWDGKSYLFYHVEGTSGYDRRVCVDRLYYRKDGTIKPVKMTKKGIKPVYLKQDVQK